MTRRVDPELVAPLNAFLAYYGGQRRLDDIPAVRARAAELTALTQAQMPPFEGIRTEDRRVPGPDGAPEVVVRIYEPARRAGMTPALLWIHGGGYIMGSIEADDLRMKQLSGAVECAVVSVEYRLAPEHPFPAALEDCYAALKWLSMLAPDLGVDGRRIAVGGASAGAGLAAALALLATIATSLRPPECFPTACCGLATTTGSHGVRTWPATLAVALAPRMPLCPGPPIWRGCRPHTLPLASWTCSSTKTLPTRSG
jgi:acetyl esterase/lipase